MASIEYLAETHTYLIDGVVRPSVSEIVSYTLDEDLNNIPIEALKKASRFGTLIHSEIENYENSSYANFDNEILKGWLELKEEYGIAVISMESIVFTNDYAGRYDMLAVVEGKESLIDIKTNRIYPEKHLEIQMGLYLKALGKQLPCYCAWYDKVNESWLLKKVNALSLEECDYVVSCFKAKNKPALKRYETVKANIYTLEETTKLKQFYALKNEIDEIEKRGRDKALEIMKQKGIKSFENEDFKITYIAPKERDDVDKEKLKADGLFEKYSKKTKIKESVRITPRWLKA